MKFPLGLRYMIEGAFYFALMSVFAKLAGKDMPFQQVVLGRSIVAMAMSYWSIRRLGLNPWGNNKVLLASRGFLGFVGLCFFFYSVVALPLADATVIHYTNPVMVAVLAALFLGEAVTRRVVFGAIAALIGVSLIARPAFLFGDANALPTIPVLAAVGGAATSAAAYTIVRQLAKTDHPMVVVFWIPLMSLPFVLPWTLLTGKVPTALEVLWLLGVGVSEQIGQVRLTQGLALEPAGRAITMTYLQVVFAFIWGIALFREVPSALALLGAGVVFASTVWVATKR